MVETVADALQPDNAGLGVVRLPIDAAARCIRSPDLALRPARGYNSHTMTIVNTRALKDHLSGYLHRAEQGEQVVGRCACLL